MIVKEYEVEAKLENFDDLLADIEGLLEDTGCPADFLYQINICFEEIYVNIANYAYINGDGDGMVRILLEITEKPYKVFMKFRDTGIPYNPLEREDPDITLSAEERQIGGLGVFFVKNMMDEVLYEYENGENVLSFMKEQKDE